MIFRKIRFANSEIQQDLSLPGHPAIVEKFKEKSKEISELVEKALYPPVGDVENKKRKAEKELRGERFIRMQLYIFYFTFYLFLCLTSCRVRTRWYYLLNYGHNAKSAL